MPDLGTRHVAHFVLRGPDHDVGTNPDVVTKIFREDTAILIARGSFGAALSLSSDEMHRTAMAEWQAGRHAAATGIGTRLDRQA